MAKYKSFNLLFFAFNLYPQFMNLYLLHKLALYPLLSPNPYYQITGNNLAERVFAISNFVGKYTTAKDLHSSIFILNCFLISGTYLLAFSA